MIAEENGTYAFALNDDVLNRGLELEFALMLLDSQLRLHLGVKAPDTVFIHAGAVAYRGRTIVMPGKSFAGKTMLVAALVDSGATYYSDEFAVIDEARPRPSLCQAALAARATTDHADRPLDREPRLDRGLGAASARRDRGH